MALSSSSPPPHLFQLFKYSSITVVFDFGSQRFQRSLSNNRTTKILNEFLKPFIFKKKSFPARHFRTKSSKYYYRAETSSSKFKNETNKIILTKIFYRENFATVVSIFCFLQIFSHSKYLSPSLHLYLKHRNLSLALDWFLLLGRRDY